MKKADLKILEKVLSNYSFKINTDNGDVFCDEGLGFKKVSLSKIKRFANLCPFNNYSQQEIIDFIKTKAVKFSEQEEKAAKQNEKALKKSIKIKEVLKRQNFIKTFCIKDGVIYLGGKEITQFGYSLIRQQLVSKNILLTDEEIKEYLTELWNEKDPDSVTVYVKPVDKKPEGWKGKLTYNEKGEVVKTLGNTVTFFSESDLFKNTFSFNELTQIENYNNEDIQDCHIANFRLECENCLGFESRDKVETAVTKVCHDYTFHPYKQEIEKLVWDGTERLEDFFIKFVGVDDTELNRKMTRNWFYGLIKRIYEPGCDFDYMLIVQDQTGGTGKSKIMERFVKVFGINYGYDSTITADVTYKDNVDKLNKAIVVSFEELADFDKKELPQVKSFISANSETARLSYDRRSKEYKRHCVFYGNSNEEYCLNDYTSIDTSERRFWFMEAHGERRNSAWWRENMPDEYLKQMWAEAFNWYLNDKYYDVTLDKDESEELRIVQNRHKKIGYEDVLSMDIHEALNKKAYLVNNNGCIETVDLFLRQFDSEDTVLNPSFINKIPVVWVKKLIENKLKKAITTNKLTFILSDEWEYKKERYNGIVSNCYVRREKMTESSENMPF